MGKFPRRPKRQFIEQALLAGALGLFAAACSVDSAKNHYVLAEKLWTDQKYAAAVSEFEKVTAKDPHGKLGLQALFRAATTQSLFLFQYGDAIRKFNAYADSADDPRTVWEAKTQIGEILFAKTEQYDAAIQHYSRLLQQYPDARQAPEFKFRIAKSHFFLRQFREAIQAYEDLIRRYPRTPWAEKAAFEIGTTYYSSGGQSDSSRDDSDDSPSRGTYDENTPYKRAIAAYRKFIDRYPKSPLVPEAKFGIASCYEEMEDLDQAYQAYEDLKSSYPSPSVIQVKLLRIRERKAQRNR